MNKKERNYLFLCFDIVFIDQILKYLVVCFCKKFPIKNFFLSFVYVKNYNGPCGIGGSSHMFSNSFFLFLEILCLTSFVLIFKVFFVKNFKNRSIFALSLIFSGGFSNIIDRIFRGFVIDYIKIDFFPYIFNFADVCIFFGMIVFFCQIYFAKTDESDV